MAANHQKGSGYMVNWLGAENMGPEMDINDCQWTLDMKASFKRFFLCMTYAQLPTVEMKVECQFELRKFTRKTSYDMT